MRRVNVIRKWRPRLSLVIGLVCVLLVALPVLALVSARLTANQFVREIERSLLAQAAIYAEAYALSYATLAPAPAQGQIVSEAQRARLDAKYHPVEPKLTADADEILPPRPDGLPTPDALDFPYAEISGALQTLAIQAQKTTLAGYLAVDAAGKTVAASSARAGLSFAHLPEVEAALGGEIVTSLRYRSDQTDLHPLNSISRDTRYRVFVTHPVIVGDRIVGAVHLSRTPVDLKKFLYLERHTLIRVGVIMLLGSFVVGFLLLRLISGPIRGVVRQSQDVVSGLKPVPSPLRRYGVRELAEMGQSVISMAQTLSNRSDAIKTYTAHVTHELKSPVTSIIGAAELLGTAEAMPQDKRDRLVANIHAEGVRMNELLGRLRELARATAAPDGQPGALPNILEEVRREHPTIEIVDASDRNGAAPLSLEQGVILLSHMVQNAHQHGASKVTVAYDPEEQRLTVRDDGNGISSGNIARVAEPFFTTRREAGGTGMGLAIVAAILAQAGGALKARESDQGAHFEITFATP